MGKGDRRSRKGKIWRGSYGNARPRKSNKSVESTKSTKEDSKTTKSEETA